MKILVVSKPHYNYYLPLVDFPRNGDLFNIDSAITSIYGEANVAAYMLAKYGIDVSYTGITGKDEAGEKFRKILEEANVDIRYMEMDYEQNTDVSYSIIKTEKTGFARIKVNSMKKDLVKYKYDFTPDFIVFDDKDFSGANAILNNYSNVPTIFYGDKPTKDAINMCKRATYVVCNINFASKLTGLEIELHKPKTIVNLYQKLIDLYQCTWIITLGEHGVIYCNDMQVKMIPGIPTEVKDADKAGGIFFGTFAYCIINGLDIEESVRLANINASASLGEIGASTGFLATDKLMSYKVVHVTENTNQVESLDENQAQVETINSNQINNQNEGLNQVSTPEINTTNEINSMTGQTSEQVQVTPQINQTSEMNNNPQMVMQQQNQEPTQSVEVNTENNVQ